MRKLSSYGPSLIVLSTAAAVLLAGPYAVRELTHARTEARIRLASERLADNPILEELNNAYREIAALVEPSVVHISAARVVQGQLRTNRSISSGSGWIWDSSGHIVTNYHVVEDAQRIEVQLYDGGLRDAELIGADPFTDIAVIKVDPGRLIPSQRISANERVRQGDMVFAFGSPFDFRFSMSSGIVSGIGRSVGLMPGRSGGYENFIQVDAAINPGNSGGPLTNHRGEVIGMNTAIATRRNGGAVDDGQFAGIGLAIPMSMIDPVVSQIITTGEVVKGFLGVASEGTLSRDLIRELSGLGLPAHGVEVNSVTSGAPADKAGVQPRDIITAIDDVPISSMEQLRAVVSSKQPGETIDLNVLRRSGPNGRPQQLTLSVTLERLNPLVVNGRMPENQSQDQIPELGIQRMAVSSMQIAARFQMQQTPGVVITEIVTDSQLSRQNIKPGTTIIAVGDQPVNDTEELIGALRDYDLRRGARVAGIDPDGEQIVFLLRVQQ